MIQGIRMMECYIGMERNSDGLNLKTLHVQKTTIVIILCISDISVIKSRERRLNSDFSGVLRSGNLGVTRSEHGISYRFILNR